MCSKLLDGPRNIRPLLTYESRSCHARRGTHMASVIAEMETCILAFLEDDSRRFNMLFVDFAISSGNRRHRVHRHMSLGVFPPVNVS